MRTLDIGLELAGIRLGWLQDREQQVKRLLGRWVSELEPTIFIVQDLNAIGGNRLLGVGYGPAGRPAVYLENL